MNTPHLQNLVPIVLYAVNRRMFKLNLLLLFCFLSFRGSAVESAQVTLIRTPDDGIQPQAAVDARGTVHLIYYKGESGAGDLFYVKRSSTAKEFSNPIRINSQQRSALSAGTIRGAQLAVGKNGRVHVAWDGMGKGATKVNIDGKDVTPLLYTRLNDAGTAFEPERNVITYAAGLDGGSSVAADSQGNVYVVWHGRAPESQEGEAGRAVFVARSTDDGKTFQRETPAAPKQTGACACCGMRAFADSRGAVYILYRAATESIERGETLLIARGPGAAFEIAYSHPWKATVCPMSSASLTETKGGALAAWETGSDVYFAKVDPRTIQVSPPITPIGGVKRKHPVVVANDTGETLFVWTEGTAWAKGGSVGWQVFDKDGRATSAKGRADGIPAWSLPTAFATADGGFTVVY